MVVDALRRREVMAHRARTLANEVEGTPSVDASIWSQWQYLTEYPGLVRAEFRPDYLALPEEVLVTVMRVHQKQLPIRDRNGRLLSSFLAVLDNEGDPVGNAAYGNSFVTNARFADAQFFYRPTGAGSRGAPRPALAPAVPGEARQLPGEDASASSASPPASARRPASPPTRAQTRPWRPASARRT